MELPGRKIASAGAACLALAAALVLASPAAAATFHVAPGAADAVDADPGDGVCDDGTGACPLRAAVNEANAFPGADTIVLPAGTHTLTIPGAGENFAATGDLDLTAAVTIRGAGHGATVVEQAADPGDRVFDLRTGTPVVIEGLTVSGGTATGESGGGIRKAGTFSLTLRRVAVAGNVATAPSADLRGGGVADTTAGELVVDDSVISGNIVRRTDGDAGGGPDGGGISIDSSGKLVIRRSEISGNHAESPGSTTANAAVGGGVFALSAEVVIEDSTIAGNSAGGGGAIFRSSGGGDVRIAGSTLSDNDALNGSGGAILSFAPAVAIERSTISGNSSSFDGAGIRVNVGTMRLADVTLAGNAGGLGDAVSAVVATVELSRTILASGGGDPVDECAGSTFESLGDNLQAGTTFDPDCGLGPATNDVLATAAELALGPLDANGGPTPTHAIGPASAAAGAVSGPCPGPLATDQRGVPRPGRGGGAACDVGAFEHARLGVGLKAAKRLAPGRELRARATCLGAACDLAVRAVVRLRGGGRAMTLRPKPLSAAGGAGQSRQLAFTLTRRQARLLRARLATAAGRKRTRVRFSVAASFGGQSARAATVSRFRRG